MSEDPARPVIFFVVVAAALAGAGTAAAFVLAGEPVVAGVSVALGGGLLEGAILGVSRSPRLLLVGAVAERVLEAAVLGAIAWAAIPADAPLATAAITALGVSYLRGYFHVRSESLGFDLAPAAWVRAVPPLFLALALLTVMVEMFLWSLVGFSILVVVMEAIQVGRQREAR